MKAYWIVLSFCLAIFGSTYATDKGRGQTIPPSRQAGIILPVQNEEKADEEVPPVKEVIKVDNRIKTGNAKKVKKIDDYSELAAETDFEDDGAPEITKKPLKAVKGVNKLISKHNRTKLTKAATTRNNTNETEAVATQYQVKHYLTAEQKYYMLRINLLGIGIYVVHDIIPIPISITDQYTKAMENLLSKIEATRPAAANATANGMHNISLEDAHQLQKSMAGDDTAAASKGKKSSHSYEILIIAAVVVGVIFLGVLIWACRKSSSGKQPDSYYDPLRPSGGMQLN